MGFVRIRRTSAAGRTSEVGRLMERVIQGGELGKKERLVGFKLPKVARVTN